MKEFIFVSYHRKCQSIVIPGSKTNRGDSETVIILKQNIIETKCTADSVTDEQTGRTKAHNRDNSCLSMESGTPGWKMLT